LWLDLLRRAWIRVKLIVLGKENRVGENQIALQREHRRRRVNFKRLTASSRDVDPAKKKYRDGWAHNRAGKQRS